MLKDGPHDFEMRDHKCGDPGDILLLASQSSSTLPAADKNGPHKLRSSSIYVCGVLDYVVEHKASFDVNHPTRVWEHNYSAQVTYFADDPIAISTPVGGTHRGDFLVINALNRNDGVWWPVLKAVGRAIKKSQSAKPKRARTAAPAIRAPITAPPIRAQTAALPVRELTAAQPIFLAPKAKIVDSDLIVSNNDAAPALKAMCSNLMADVQRLEQEKAVAEAVRKVKEASDAAHALELKALAEALAREKIESAANERRALAQEAERSLQ